MDSKQTVAPRPVTPAYTMMLKIRPGQVENLRKALEGRDPYKVDRLGILHFSRYAISLDGSYLLFASNYDGDVDSYLDDFYAADTSSGGPSEFDSVLQYTEGYPGTGNREAFVAFWKGNKVEENFNYCYYPGHTAKEIRKALRVQEAFQNVLDQPGAAEALKHPALKALLAEAAD
jgi:hypothetical protein